MCVGRFVFNRYRYYAPNSGIIFSKEPIGLIIKQNDFALPEDSDPEVLDQLWPRFKTTGDATVLELIVSVLD